MSRIDALVEQLCPDGVESRTLGEIGELVRGNGMPKSDFADSGVGCIHYGQIYTYYGTWTTETISFVPAEKAQKLAKVDPGDLIIANTSENVEDVCKAVAWLGETQIVTGGHATVLKHTQDPRYLSYYLQTPAFFAEKKKRATGTKVIDVSARSLASIKILVPPLEVQREIVAILDKFDALVNDLSIGLPAELHARRQQYAYYRSSLLTFANSDKARSTPLGDLVDFTNGKPHERLVDPDGDIALMTSKFISTQGRSARFVHSSDVLTPAHQNEIAMVMSDLPNGRALARAFYVDSDDRYAANQRVCLLRVRNEQVADPRFLFYMVDRNKQLLSYDSGVDQTHLKKGDILAIEIPVPALSEQRRIVAILDKFDALVNDLSSGLPAELNARRQQYEYYRDRLLTFAEAA